MIEYCADTGYRIIKTPDGTHQCPDCWLEQQPSDCVVELRDE